MGLASNVRRGVVAALHAKEGLVVLWFVYDHILELPFFGEGVVIGIKLKLIRFEADFIEKGVESLEVHLVYIFLLNSLSEDGLICKAYRPASLR